MVYEERKALGSRIHVFEDNDGRWEVWLDTDISTCDGLCVAVGKTRAIAVQKAQRLFDRAAIAVRLPMKAFVRTD